MDTQNISKQAQQLNDLQINSKKLSAGIWKKIRNNANEFFIQNGWPSRNLESWHYTSLLSMLDQKIEIAKSVSLKNQKQSKIHKSVSDLIQDYCQSFDSEIIKMVFVNGQFSTDFSDIKKLQQHHIFISTGQEFLQHTDKQSFIHEFIHERRSVQFQPKSSIEAINSAKFTDGIFIRIEKEQSLSMPIHIIHLAIPTVANTADNLRATELQNKTKAKNTNQTSDVIEATNLPLIQNKIFIEVSPFAKVNFVESYIGENKYFINNTAEIVLRKSCNVGYYIVNANSDLSTSISTNRFFQHEFSQLDCRTFTWGGQLNRTNLEFYLRQKECSLVSKGFYIGSANRHTDHSSFIDHVVGQCQSTQLYKGLLTDSAKGIFDGTVQIRKNSQKANSDQLIKNLLLSNKAEANSKPQLLIHADDVKATHGSTVGQINPEELFYFESRAIDKKTAIQMLSLGFVEDIIFEIENATIRKFLLKQTEKAFAKQIHFK